MRRFPRTEQRPKSSRSTVGAPRRIIRIPRRRGRGQRGNARSFVEPLGGRIAVEFFDVGHSRSVPWDRRPQARRLLTGLKNSHRGWSAVVVGEGTRSWFGNQFSLVAPRLAAYGVELWVPELGGRFDPHNPSHTMLMSVLGGMSESERQHVQARVRAAMDAQVLNQGRHQGGRARYGYVTVDGGPHPHPGKAAEGARLKVLDVDQDTAPVVQRIFAGRHRLAAALQAPRPAPRPHRSHPTTAAATRRLDHQPAPTGLDHRVETRS
jgi:DNA invertase Pin-like site-specific DNA recombinase